MGEPTGGYWDMAVDPVFYLKKNVNYKNINKYDIQMINK